MLISSGWFEFVLLGLAIYRVARMMAMERGPFDAFRLWRDWVGKHFKHNKKTGRQSWVDEGFNCPLCLSFWGGVVSAWILSPISILAYVVVALALGGFAAALFKITG
jgi:hypothetical protein